MTRRRPARWCRIRSPGAEGERDGALTSDGAPEGFLNLGLNGSYMVVRELRQDVARVLEIAGEERRSASGRTIRLRRTSPPTGSPNGSSAATSTAICSARPACWPPDRDNFPDNAFGFIKDRSLRRGLPAGLACAPGQSARRPRQGPPTAAQTLLDAANNHRILRRGRKFGPGSRTATRTTARNAACCSCASTPTSRANSSSSSRPGC